ncbi:MAG: hypothetical protein AAB110_05380, partial [Candidatus Desantisbacteria bacterium]
AGFEEWLSVLALLSSLNTTLHFLHHFPVLSLLYNLHTTLPSMHCSHGSHYSSVPAPQFSRLLSNSQLLSPSRTTLQFNCTPLTIHSALCDYCPPLTAYHLPITDHRSQLFPYRSMTHYMFVKIFID